MTNGMIILLESVALMEQGVLQGTGEFITIEEKDGTKKELEIPESIHTYQKWKELGYQVQKGQKAVAQFMIWKHHAKVDELTGEEKDAKMFMKKASFFKGSQVEKGGAK